MTKSVGIVPMWNSIYDASMSKINIEQKGFTLIEIMIACALSVYISSAIILLFLSISKTYLFQQTLSRIQENGRFLSFYLREQIHKAGIDNCSSDKSTSIKKRVIKAYSGKEVKPATDSFALQFCYQLNQRYRWTWVAYYIGHDNVLYEKAEISNRRPLVSDIESMKINLAVGCASKLGICEYLSMKEITAWSQIKAISIETTIQGNKEVRKSWPIYAAFRN